jgi:hypothetical protein
VPVPELEKEKFRDRSRFSEAKKSPPLGSIPHSRTAQKKNFQESGWLPMDSPRIKRYSRESVAFLILD